MLFLFFILVVNIAQKFPLFKTMKHVAKVVFLKNNLLIKHILSINKLEVYV